MPTPGQRRLGHASIALTCLGLFATWALATARYGGPDEPSHVLRAAAVADGDLLGAAVPGLVGGFRAVDVPAALATGDPRCFRHDQREPATCAVAEAGATGTRRAATSAGTYPPWYYAMVGLPVRWIGDASDVVWYRLIAAAWCAAALVAAMVRSRRAGSLLVLAAISPAAWFLFGIVNPNSLEIALAALAWVGVERVRKLAEPPTSELWWIGVPAALAIAIRPVAVVAFATMLVVLGITHWRRSGAGPEATRPPSTCARPDARRPGLWRWAILAVGPAIALALTLGWSLWSHVVVTDARAATTLDLVGRFTRSASDTSDTVRELAGSLGWLEFSAPWPAQLVWWVSAAFVGAVVWRQGWRSRLAWLAIATSVLMVPIAFETVLAGQTGFIWQGRYSIPTAIGLVIVGSGGIGTDTLRRTSRVWSALPRLLLGGTALAEILTFWATLRRYMVGTNGSWMLQAASWRPPVPAFGLIALNMGLICWILNSSWRRLNGSDSDRRHIEPQETFK